MLRGTLLYLSERPSLKRMFGGPLGRPLVHRFVAGETLDYLGESVNTAAEASTAAIQYIAILHAIERAGVQGNASLKLTQMGLDIDRGLCQRNVERIVAQAAQFKNFVRIDMEGSDYTQVTLDIFKDIFSRHKNVGVVIQS